MIVKETYKEPTGPFWDNAGPWSLTIETEDGKKQEIWAYEPQPEDATFARDLSFVFSIVELLKAAYNAGKNGENFEYEYVEKKQEDE
jgi:hypothetical protein